MTQGRPGRLKLFYQQEQAEDIGVSVPEVTVGSCLVTLSLNKMLKKKKKKKKPKNLMKSLT